MCQWLKAVAPGPAWFSAYAYASDQTEPSMRKYSRWSSDNGLTLFYNPIMGCAPRRSVLLDFQQPMQSFGGGELDTDCIALSAVNGLDRLAPAYAARQFDREHLAFPPVLSIGPYGIARNDAMPLPLRHRGKWLTVSANAGRRSGREDREASRDSGNATGDRRAAPV